jgi:hypothetical protein
MEQVMKHFGRIAFFVGLAMVGNTASVHAQPSDRFHRVTTVAQRDLRTTNTRDLESRSGSARDLRSVSSVDRVALVTRGRATRSSAYAIGALDFYTARAEAELRHRESGPGSYSTWRQQPEPSPRAPQGISPARSHTYYPGLRSGVALSQPVTLTANSNILYQSPCCSASRSQAMAQGAHHGSAGVMQHR